ncbi:MAG TPA: acetyltransferase [Bacteroidia bacterium]|jgi:sugar O-acyltransferase (sialic acid O-acetyltransferase NeuD family)
MKKKIVIIGAGGHGRVIADLLCLSAEYELVGFADDGLMKGAEVMEGKKVLAASSEKEFLSSLATHFVVCLGNNSIRKKIVEDLSGVMQAATLIHPSAVVSRHASLGAGTVVLANAVINAGCKIGINCIINSISLVDHDSVVGDHVHIAQGTVIGSNCRIAANFSSVPGQVIPSNSTAG